jgi:hypothetical protein
LLAGTEKKLRTEADSTDYYQPGEYEICGFHACKLPDHSEEVYASTPRYLTNPTIV